MSARRSDAAAGKRDRLVQLVPLTQGVGADRFPTETPGNAIELWASRDDIGGRERIVMNQESAPFDTRWILPFSDTWDPERVDVPKAFQLTHGGRTYDIVHAAIIGRRLGVEVLTLARQG